MPYPGYERGRLYKRIFDMPTCLVSSALGPVLSCLTILWGRLSIAYAARLVFWSLASFQAWPTMQISRKLILSNWVTEYTLSEVSVDGLSLLMHYFPTMSSATGNFAPGPSPELRSCTLLGKFRPQIPQFANPWKNNSAGTHVAARSTVFLTLLVRADVLLCLLSAERLNK